MMYVAVCVEDNNVEMKTIGVNKFRYRDRRKDEENVGGETSNMCLTTLGKKVLIFVELTMFPHKTTDGFRLTLNHEIIHAYHTYYYTKVQLHKHKETPIQSL